jgi:hypothetical protein
MIDEKRLKTTPAQHIRNLIDSIKNGQISMNAPEIVIAEEGRCLVE